MTWKEEQEIREKAETEYKAKRDKAINDAINFKIAVDMASAPKDVQRSFLLTMILTLLYFGGLILGMYMSVTYGYSWFVWVTSIPYMIYVWCKFDDLRGITVFGCAILSGMVHAICYISNN